MKRIFIAAILTVASLTANACYSEGMRAGSVQKFSKKGVINKSWEGEIVMEGTKFKGANGVVRGGNVWAFSVLDPKVAVEIESAMMSGNVILKYCEESPLNPTWKLTTQTPYIVVSAKAMLK